MKILYITTGGSYGADQSLMTLLDALGDKVTPYVVMPHLLGLQNLLDQKAIPYAKIRMRQYSVPKIKSLKDFIYFPIKLFIAWRYNAFVAPKLKRIIRDFRPDIIHTNAGVFRMGYKIARRKGIPHVWHLREYQDRDMGRWILGGKKRLIQLLKQRGNYPVPITRCIADYFDVPHSHVVYNGVLQKDRLPFCPQKENYFLYAGAMYEEKGVTALVEAFCRFALHNGNYRLYLAGGSSRSYKKKLMQIIHRSHIPPGSVLFIGKQPKEEIARWMSIAAAIFVPSRSEAFGRVVAEAMANGCLVIAHDAHGIKEQLDNGLSVTGGEIGVRCAASAEDMAKKMQEVADNGIQHYFPMIKRSQQAVNRLYTSEEYSDKMYEIYRKLLTASLS
ncbi:MAG: glycosyltransferase family 4 protein [Prevotellaceae bacterium]|jgi:glycosyltransferase involved in cell wall biosynthesis|nr:glycosyltransferase family 4 protein [Prevotellaceae bacterium]